MGIYENFQLSKLRMVLKKQGVFYKFLYFKKNDFGEFVDEVDKVFDILGLFHTSQGYITVVTTDSGSIPKKDNPEIMCFWSEAKDIPQGAIVEICNQKYKVNFVTDVGNMHVIANISLEVILNGNYS